MTPRRRGLILRPLLDDHHELTTRAALMQTERGDQNEYEAERVWRVAVDPGLVAEVAALQGGAL
jgi:hypothetical protein